MKYFCKGVLLGALVGMAVGAIAVVKNKKLASGLKENLDKAEKKVTETAQKVMKKIKEKKQEKENQSQNESNQNMMQSNNSNQNNNFNCCQGENSNMSNCNCGC